MNDPPVQRLTAVDLINLHVETPAAPTRVGALAILDGSTLVDPSGGLRLAAIRETIGRRLDGVPRLRQVIRRAGPFAGRPVWADDPAFRLDRHVRQVALAPGRDLNDLAMRLVNSPLDRAHPLWCMWFVTGLPGGDLALVFGMHHVVADGVTTVRLIGSLMDAPPIRPQPPAVRRWVAQPPPPWGALVQDNLHGMLSAPRFTPPGQWRRMSQMRNAPRTSLNHPVGANRRLAAVTMDLAAAKAVAHRHRCKINDVVLAVAAGGIRALLQHRSEPVDGVRVHVSVAVSLRPSGIEADVGNRSGGIALRVPLDADPHERLGRIARESAEAKSGQLPTAGNSLLVWLTRTGLLRYFSRHQRMINIVESNVAGPPATISLLGAPIRSIIPIGTLVGNLALGFLALSYAGRLTIAVQADADRYRDLAVLVAAMEHDCSALLTSGAPPPPHPVDNLVTSRRKELR
ncbi:wax ester/triacylglycerol synthase domain-containing protein [Actinoplanes sp. NPDC026623]|uniref:wax ester/triacylglycerol synthase domain-containing protein n=1 Tax=Actinoplanes sp. NPDC026623 TaxID=3155610 RepID=UPI0033C8B405